MLYSTTDGFEFEALGVEEILKLFFREGWKSFVPVFCGGGDGVYSGVRFGSC